MKKNALFAAAIALSAALLPFVSCSDDEEESEKLETVYAELPASVGENPFAGKTWEYTSDYSDKEYEYYWAFTNDTAVYTYSRSYGGETRIETSTYSYTYDAEKSLLFLGLKSYKYDSSDDSEDYEYSNAEELRELYDKWYEEELAEAKEEGLELTDEQKKALKAGYDSDFAPDILRFSLVDTKKFEISENKVKFTDYFDGKFPTLCSFRYSNYSDNFYFNYYRTGCWWRFGTTERNDQYLENLKMSDGKFSGDVTSSDWNTYTFKTYGKAKGTYELANVNSTEAKITFTFTEIPDGVTALSVNTPYTLTLDTDDTEYTLVTE